MPRRMRVQASNTAGLALTLQTFATVVLGGSRLPHTQVLVAWLLHAGAQASLPFSAPFSGQARVL